MPYELHLEYKIRTHGGRLKSESQPPSETYQSKDNAIATGKRLDLKKLFHERQAELVAGETIVSVNLSILDGRDQIVHQRTYP
jgi:hypothetical protein